MQRRKWSELQFLFDLLHTALIGGAVVYDTSGNIVKGATITSSSGYDYTQPLTETNTPEPATFGLIGGALIAMAIVSTKARLNPRKRDTSQH
jgi:hypothetical protein